MNTIPRIKNLTQILPKQSGRDNQGHVSVRHQGGRQKRYLRIIDFKREKAGIPARVVSIGYDPNRTADIALLIYADGEKRYILSPENLRVGDIVMSGNGVDIKVGNALPLANIPVGTIVHCVELTPGKGAVLMRSAGTGATVLSKESGYVQIKMPSGEVRQIRETAIASVGQVGRLQHRHEKIGSAGRARRLGRRPTVRGVAQNPRSHPHGGGEGRSGVGMSSPKTPWGKRVGIHTRKPNKYSDRFIVKRRK